MDGPVPIWPPITYATFEASGVRTHAEQLATAGVDALKGYAGLDAEMVDSLVRAAADHDLPVVVDLGTRGDYATAVEPGVAARAQAPSGPFSNQDIAAMVRNGTATITNLAVLESFARRRLNDLAFLDHPLISFYYRAVVPRRSAGPRHPVPYGSGSRARGGHRGAAHGRHGQREAAPRRRRAHRRRIGPNSCSTP